MSIEIKDLDASRALYRICNKCRALNDAENDKCFICGNDSLCIDPEEIRLTIELLKEEYGNHGVISIKGER